MNNLQSILRISSSNCVNTNDLGSECIWIKQDSCNFTNSLLFENKEFDNILSKKYFYLDEAYLNLIDLKKNENYLKMKKSKQQMTGFINSQDKQNSRSSSLVNAKNKLNKKVDFLDLKLNNCLNKTKKNENNSLPSSSQSSPKSTLSNQHSNEDSFADSNFSSSSSSDMIQFSKSSKKLSSLSSTSSGVGSSNVSSASSTTSESILADNFSSSKSKIAPKAIISDDGDIEIEKPSNYSKIPKPAETSRSSMRIIDQSIYKNEQKNYNNIYYVNAKNSIKLNNRNSQHVSIPQNAYHQQSFYQSQFAVAAAAAAAVRIFIYRIDKIE